MLYHVSGDDDVPVADDVVRIYGAVRLFRRDEEAFRLTEQDRRHVVTADRRNAVVCITCIYAVAFASHGVREL